MNRVRCLLAIFVVLPAACLGQDQTKTNTHIWSPMDRQFSVEVPVDLKVTKGYSQADEPEAVRTYAAKKDEFVFVAVVLKFRDFETETSDEKFGGLPFMIGGDDDWEYTKKSLISDGFPAQEVVYKNQVKRGLFIDAGETVFVLGVFAKKQEDLDAVVVKRFFSSFRMNHFVR